MTNEFEFILEDTKAKLKSILTKIDLSAVRVAYSGGSDSDTVLHLIKSCGFNVKSVFYDTGIEWDATKRHIHYMQSIGFDIEVIKAIRPVPTSNREYGHPFINKRVSDYLSRLQKYDFDFKKHGNLSFEILYEIYPKCRAALRWWCNDWGDNSRFNIDYNKYLKEFLIDRGLPFKVSNKCCEGAKKLLIKIYAKQNNIDLMILGIRKSEGGSRSTAYKSCYQSKKNFTYAMYFPLFFWVKGMKEWYDDKHNVIHSDCYAKYGLNRTGCAGCPFGLNFEHELNQLTENEPKLAKGIKSIFSPSYEWTREYKKFVTSNKNWRLGNKLF